MSDANKHNLLYFENSSMRALYNDMDEWQHANHRRLHSISIQQEGNNYCCIALTNPTEVVITNADGTKQVDVHGGFYFSDQYVPVALRVHETK
jgi:hypothetical protein